ncbi:MAG: hypothetical protein BJ554DRAFT_2252, partial [Olpidium bornovanus]
IENAKIPGHDLIVKDGARRNVYAGTVVGNDDDGSLEHDVVAERDVARYGKVVQLEDVRGPGEPGQEVGDLLKVVSELHVGYRGEQAPRVHRQLAVVQRVQIRGDQEQVRSRLDWQEARPRHVDAVRAFEMFDRRADGRLQLDDLLALVGRLVVYDDVQIELLVLQDALDRLQVDPDVIGVKDLEFLDGLEILDLSTKKDVRSQKTHVLGRHLRDLEQPYVALVIDEGSSLYVGLSLVRQFHQELRARLLHVRQYRCDPTPGGVNSRQITGREKILPLTKINDGSQVVHVADEQVLLAVGNQLVQLTRIVEALEQIAVAGRVPVADLAVRVTRDRKKGLLVYTWVAGLVEGDDVDVVPGVPPDDPLGVVARKFDREILRIRPSLPLYLNLADSQIQECHAVPDLDRGLGPDAAHRGSKTAIELEHHQLVEQHPAGSFVGRRREAAVRNNLLRGVDLVPVTVLTRRGISSADISSVRSATAHVTPGMTTPIAADNFFPSFRLPPRDAEMRVRARETIDNPTKFRTAAHLCILRIGDQLVKRRAHVSGGLQGLDSAEIRLAN